jgi:hypothetical protein
MPTLYDGYDFYVIYKVINSVRSTILSYTSFLLIQAISFNYLMLLYSICISTSTAKLPRMLCKQDVGSLLRWNSCLPSLKYDAELLRLAPYSMHLVTDLNPWKLSVRLRGYRIVSSLLKRGQVNPILLSSTHLKNSALIR